MVPITKSLPHSSRHGGFGSGRFSFSSPVSTAKDSRCYTVEDLMEMLLLSRPTVYRLLKQNEFLWFKVSGAYRISKASFEAWLNDGTVERNPAV